MKITKDDILKLAQISMIDVSPDEIPILIERLDTLLNYVSCLKELAQEVNIPELPHNTNILREDNSREQDYVPLMNLAPEKIDNYFVVPMILKKPTTENK